jgi:hypothetical protein
MGLQRFTIGVSRADLTRDCLRNLHLWPGCETVQGLAVLGNGGGNFSVHVVDYGLAKNGRQIARLDVSKGRRRGASI